MIQVQTRPKATHFLFLGFVIAVYTVALTVASRLPNFEKADVMSTGITVDMVILVPLAFYFLIVRRGGHSIVRLAPVVIVSLLFASLVVPAGHQHSLHILETVLVPVELGLLGWIIWRASGSLRRVGRNPVLDPLEQFRSAAFELFNNAQVAGVFASEIAVFYYSLGAWRSRPHCPVGTESFTHHQRSGQAGFVFAFLFLMACEGFGVHLLLVNWSFVAAWIFTISTIYGAFWLIADFRATVLRPVLVSEERVQIRSGLRYSLTVSRSQIFEVSRKKPEFGKENLNLKLMGEPTHWIIFSESVIAQGPYGTRRNVRAVGIEPDDIAGFERALVRHPA